MATLTIGDRQVTVDDAFLKLTPEQQNTTVEEIAGSLGIKGDAPAPEAAAEPKPEKTWRETLGEYNLGSAALGLYDAVNLPRQVYEGEVDLNTEEGTERVLGAATAITPATAGRLTTQAAKSALFKNPAAGKVIAPEAAPAVAPAVNGVVDSALRLGETGAPLNVPKGVASESQAVQAAFLRGKQAPGATAVVERSMDDFYKGVEGKVDEVATAAAGGKVKDTAELGASVRTSLEKAIEKSEADTDDAFKVMRKAIDPEKRVLIQSDDVAKTLADVKAIRAAAGEAEISPQLASAFKILEDPEGVSFSGLQRARSQIGRAIKWDGSQGGFNTGDLKKVYGALTKSMEDVTRQTAKINPENATKLWKAADARFAKMAGENKVLSSVLRKDADEALVSSIVGMASGKAGNARKLSQVLREIGPESKGELSGFVVQGLGKGRDGNFSAIAFSNNWEKLSPTGKAQLFETQALRQSLEDLSVVTKRMADAQKKFDNSSRTGGAVGQMIASAGLVTNPVQTVIGLLGANVAARALSKPATVREIVSFAKVAEVYVKNPTRAAKLATEKAVQRLATNLSAQLGVKMDASQLMAANDDAPTGQPLVTQGRM